MARIPGSHPSYSGSIPGQGIKISFHAMAHCCLAETPVFRHPWCESRAECRQSVSGVNGRELGQCPESWRTGHCWGETNTSGVRSVPWQEETVVFFILEDSGSCNGRGTSWKEMRS